MATEIERKFLVTDNSWQSQVTERKSLRQGYLTRSNGPAVVRIRMEDGKGAQITVKSSGHGLVRGEFEYEIPADDAIELLRLCGDYVLSKVGHVRQVGVNSQMA